MSKYTITIIDTIGIQPYIFGSNRLRENIGASHLVDAATNDWVEEELCNLLGKNKFYFPTQTNERHIEQDTQLMAEVIYVGGGNAVILFRHHANAIEFTKKLSSRILEQAPGLNIIVVHGSVDWDNERLNDKVDHLMKTTLENKKRQFSPSVPLLGLGVNADCLSTRLVAIGTSTEFGSPKDGEYLVSREVKYKIQAVKPANERLRDIFGEVLKDYPKYEFASRFDELGRTKEESSYLAVVHADGNGMGDRFKEYAAGATDNRDYITKMRRMSKSVYDIGIDALKEVLKKLIARIDGNFIKSSNPAISKIELKKENDKILYLPFRPLIYGGDDITFVCDGRLGLTLAALFLTELEKKPAADNKIITACAGISIVKSHYPFVRAYDLCESLCKSAKKLVKKSNTKFSALDWHIAASGLMGSLMEIRNREYRIGQDKKLEMRPICLKSENHLWQNWESFEKVTQEFLTGESWSGKRNKVVALREVLRQGTNEATKQFLKAYQLSELPKYDKAGVDECSQAGENKFSETGWINDNNQIICGYFDPIEAMEFYFPI